MKKFRIFILSVFLIATVYYANSLEIDSGDFSANVRSTEIADQSLSNLSGAKEEFIGTFQIMTEERFNKGKFEHKEKYFLFTDRGQFVFEPTNIVNVSLGQEIRVLGYKKGEKIVGEIVSVKSGNKVIPGPTPVIKNNQKVAVFLINFLDSGNPPFDVAQAQNIYFGGNQFQNFYKEQSYNKIIFSGKVFDWITLPRNSVGSACGAYFGNGAELDPYIDSLNINLNDYDHVLFQFDCSTEAPGNLWGMATLGKINYFVSNPGKTANTSVVYTSYGDNLPNRYNDNSVWSSFGTPFNFSWTNFDSLVAHEMGHALGVMHANMLECGGQTISNICVNIDYGNDFDIMGFQPGFGFHMNAYYKEVLGFLGGTNSLTINQSGTYTISNLESSGTGAKSAKVKMAGLNKYPLYVEFRKAVGFDSGLNDPTTTQNQSGLLINRITKYPNAYFGNVFGSQLLDMTPNASNVLDRDYSLNVGNTFSDLKTGITIGPIVSQTSNSITFNVTINSLPACVSQPLTANLLYGGPTISVGQMVGVGVPIFNDDAFNCSPSKFIVSVIPPVGWPNTPFNPTSITNPPVIDPGQIIQIPFGSVLVPSVTPGIYNYNIQIDNLSSGITSNYNYPIEVL